MSFVPGTGNANFKSEFSWTAYKPQRMWSSSDIRTVKNTLVEDERLTLPRELKGRGRHLFNPLLSSSDGYFGGQSHYFSSGSREKGRSQSAGLPVANMGEETKWTRFIGFLLFLSNERPPVLAREILDAYLGTWVRM